MSEGEVALREVKTLIEHLDPDDKARTAELADELRAWLAKNGDAGHMALALVGAEMSR